MWPWRKKAKRKAKHPSGNGHTAKQALSEAQRKLEEAVARRGEVDKLARDMRRALGVHR